MNTLPGTWPDDSPFSEEEIEVLLEDEDDDVGATARPPWQPDDVESYRQEFSVQYSAQKAANARPPVPEIVPEVGGD